MKPIASAFLALSLLAGTAGIAVANSDKPDAAQPGRVFIEESLSADELRDRMKQIYHQAWNQKDYALLDDLVAPSFIDHQALPGQASKRGAAGVKQTFQAFHQAFPDLKFTVHQIVVENDWITSRYTVSGTQKGPFMGLKATGKRFQVQGYDMVRTERGKAVEHWGIMDMPTMLAQLGHAPAGQAPAKPAAKKPAAHHGHHH